MNKTLLVVGGGIEAVPGIQLAREMGLHVLVSDRNPDAPGFMVAHDRLLVDTYDVDGTVNAARRYHHLTRPLHGVMCIASDVPLTVASVATALGLPGIPVAAAKLSMDKLAMKRQFLNDGIAIPWFSPIESVSHLQEVITHRSAPLIIKPVDSRGARGVLRLTDQVDAAWAYDMARKNSPTGRVMIEEFLPGPQVSTETMMVDGEAFTVGMSDRNYEFVNRFAPHMIENGGELPCHLPPSLQHKIHCLVKRAAASLGIVSGVVKGDIVVREGEPFIIEVATRLSGGYFCTHEIPLSTGVPFVKHAIRLALGEHIAPTDLAVRHHAGVAQRYLFPRPGRVVKIDNMDQAARHPGVAYCEIRVKVGDIIPPTENHPARAGVVITTGSTRDDAVVRAKEAVGMIHIETEP